MAGILPFSVSQGGVNVSRLGGMVIGIIRYGIMGPEIPRLVAS